MSDRQRAGPRHGGAFLGLDLPFPSGLAGGSRIMYCKYFRIFISLVLSWACECRNGEGMLG
jgi:hypothetical protein